MGGQAFKQASQMGRLSPSRRRLAWIAELASTIVVALAASACCWVPAVFGVAAAGSLGLSAAFATYRPLLLVATAILLGFGFRRAYRGPKSALAGGLCCEKATAAVRLRNIRTMWLVAIVAVTSSSYPYWRSGGSTQTLASSPTHGFPTKRLVLNVPGIYCAGCAGPILTSITKVPGVVSLSVNVDMKTASLLVPVDFHREGDVLQAIKRSGYDATYRVKAQ